MHRSVRHLAVCAVCISVVPVEAGAENPVRLVRFTDYNEGSIDDWLKAKGFQFEQDAKNRNRIDFDVGTNGLVVEAKRQVFGIMPNESVDIASFTTVEIDWGVNRFPSGASYEQGVRDEALMVIVFMGDERQPSGSIFIPDSPFFVGLFLCKGNDKVNYPYVGSYFKKGGRYVCTDQPEPGELVTSRFDLLKAYKRYFDKEGDDDPAISGLAIALDTKKAGDGGKTSAFIREIRFFR